MTNRLNGVAYSNDFRIVQMKIDRNKNYDGNNITAIVRTDNEGRRKVVKQTITRSKVKPFILKGQVYPNPFEIRSVGVYDYQRLPNFYNPNFLVKLNEVWQDSIQDYILTIHHEKPHVRGKRLAQIRKACKNTSVVMYPQAVSVLKNLATIKRKGPDGVWRRKFNPEEIGGLIDRCEYVCEYGNKPFNTKPMVFDSYWLRTDGSEFDGRPYPEDTSWNDVEEAIKNGF